MRASQLFCNTLSLSWAEILQTPVRSNIKYYHWIFKMQVSLQVQLQYSTNFEKLFRYLLCPEILLGWALSVVGRGETFTKVLQYREWMCTVVSFTLHSTKLVRRRQEQLDSAASNNLKPNTKRFCCMEKVTHILVEFIPQNENDAIYMC